MARVYIDIETDGLLLECRKCFLICCKDLETGEEFYYRPELYPKDEVFQWLTTHIAKYDTAIGHNVYFDLTCLKRLYGFTFTGEVIDTLLLSQIQDYNRFGPEGHSLKTWGIALHDDKIDYHDFTQWTEEMLPYCQQDVRLGEKVYNYLAREQDTLGEKVKIYEAAEHAAQEWNFLAEWKGWPFDVEGAKHLFSELETKKAEIEKALEEKMGYKVLDCGTKSLRWKKDGTFYGSTAKDLDVDPEVGIERIMHIAEAYDAGEVPLTGLWGDYTKIDIVRRNLRSSQDVKEWLMLHGWQPVEYNFKVVEGGARVKTSPKITEADLELLGGDGQLYAEYKSICSRYSILETWLKRIDSRGKLHGEFFLIGTPSMRQRHKFICNIPSPNALYGKEIRQLFGTVPGWAMIGTDSCGNQARGLAYFLNDAEYTDIILNKDIHTYNAVNMTNALKSMGIDHEVPRSVAKKVYYAFLFGASGTRLWSYIFGTPPPSGEEGTKFKQKFQKATPGLQKLIDKLNQEYKDTKNYSHGPYIKSIAGNKIYVDSQHKLLVYLLQSTEKITCAAALMLTVKRLREKNIPFLPLVFYHDEIDYLVPEDRAEEAAAISQQAFHDGPALFGIDIMDGESKIGKNWFEVH